MDVIIYSDNIEKSTKLQHIIDNIIMDKRLRLISLHTVMPTSLAELEKSFKKDKGYLVVIDISKIKDWKKLILKISSINKRVSFCVVSENGNAAVDLINMMINVCGYINTAFGNIRFLFAELFTKLYKHITTLCGGILVTAETGELKVISFDEIYYIETIKQQHRCLIKHNNGCDTIRADITKLINMLDNRFEITRSSTIANLSRVIEFSNCLLHFEKDINCSVAAQKISFIKKIMREAAFI